MARRLYRDPSGRTLADYPRPSVAVDTAVLTVPPDAGDLHVLLVAHRDRRQRAGWALPGTFLHEGETLADAVRRSLAQKAGVVGLAPTQLHVFDALDRDDRGRVLSVAHVSVVGWGRVAPAVAARTELAAVPVAALRVAEAVGLPYDHDQIVALAVAHTRARYAERPDPDRLLAPPFTLLELRRLHEAVLGSLLPKDTFRRRMQPQLRPTGRLRQGAVGKPAELYRHRRSAAAVPGS